MTKTLIAISCVILISGLLVLPLPVFVTREHMSVPTAPPPPKATNTYTHLPPRRSTSTPSRPSSSSWKSRTPTASSSPTLTDTPALMNTLAPTLTLTPTLTPSSTSTPLLNLHVWVYLDINQNDLFEFGEGVEDILLLVNAGTWTAQTILQHGETWLALPVDLPPDSDVQVQTPYFHWSDILRASKPGEIVDASLRLELPQYPVSLP